MDPPAPPAADKLQELMAEIADLDRNRRSRLRPGGEAEHREGAPPRWGTARNGVGHELTCISPVSMVYKNKASWAGSVTYVHGIPRKK